MISAATHKPINHCKIQDVHIGLPFEKNCLFVHVFVMQLGKITINVGKHQNIAFHSKSLDMSHPCVIIIIISQSFIQVVYRQDYVITVIHKYVMKIVALPFSPTQHIQSMVNRIHSGAKW